MLADQTIRMTEESSPQRLPEFVTLDDGRMTVAAEHLPLLRAMGWESFDKVMTLTGGETKRDFPGRKTVRLEVPAAGGVVGAVYLKRYERNYLSRGRRWLRRLGWPSAQDEAGREWQGLLATCPIGIATAQPIAMGQQRREGVVERSFLLTAEIVGGIEGGLYAQGLAPAARERFLLQVAALASKFHRAGWVHKDFYISHVLVVPPATPASEPQLFLIDLQRAIQPRCCGERWVIKDLAALAYSALKHKASPRALYRAYLTYSAQGKLDAVERAFVRKILRRVAWLKTRTPRHDKDFQQLR